MELKICTLEWRSKGVLALRQKESGPDGNAVFLFRPEGPAPVYGCLGPASAMRWHRPRHGDPSWHDESVLINDHGQPVVTTSKTEIWPGIAIDGGKQFCYPIAAPLKGNDVSHVVERFILLPTARNKDSIVVLLGQDELFPVSKMHRLSRLLGTVEGLLDRRQRRAS